MPIGGRRHRKRHCIGAQQPQRRPALPHMLTSAASSPLPATHFPRRYQQTATMQAVSLSVARPGALALKPRSSARPASLRRPMTLVRASADRQEAPQAEQVAATALLVAAGLLAPMVLDTEAAQAVPDLIKGRTFSLIHPGEWAAQLQSLTARGWRMHKVGGPAAAPRGAVALCHLAACNASIAVPPVLSGSLAAAWLAAWPLGAAGQRCTDHVTLASAARPSAPPLPPPADLCSAAHTSPNHNSCARALPSPPLHPPAAIMGFLFGGSLWAGYLGFQWRRTRWVAGWLLTCVCGRAAGWLGMVRLALRRCLESLHMQPQRCTTSYNTNVFQSLSAASWRA